MESENDTVKDIVNETKFAIDYGNGVLLDLAGKQVVGILDRIDAAHRREVAELKHWIKSAARWIKCHDIYHTSGDDLIKQAKEILNDDGEFLFKKEEQ